MIYIPLVLAWIIAIGGIAMLAYWVMRKRPWDRSDQIQEGQVPPVVGLNGRGEPIYYPTLEQEPLLTERDSEARLNELYRRGEIDAATYERIMGEMQERKSA